MQPSQYNSALLGIVLRAICMYVHMYSLLPASHFTVAIIPEIPKFMVKSDE